METKTTTTLTEHDIKQAIVEYADRQGIHILHREVRLIVETFETSNRVSAAAPVRPLWWPLQWSQVHAPGEPHGDVDHAALIREAKEDAERLGVPYILRNGEIHDLQWNIICTLEESGLPYDD